MSRARTLAFTSVGHFVNDGSVFLVPLIVDILHALRGMTLFEVSILLFMFYFVSTVSSVFVGRRADRTGGPGGLMAAGIGCLGAGLVGFFVSMLYLTGAGLFAAALFCVFVMGFGSSFYHPLGGNILQTSFGRGTSGRALGLNGAMGSVGRALYPSIWGLAAIAFTVPGSMGFFGLVGAGAALLIWFGLRTAGARAPKGDGKGPSLRESLTRPMLILMGVTFVRSVALNGAAAYIPTFLTSQRDLGVGYLLGLTITVFYASAIVGQPVFGLLIERLDHRLVLAISAAGGAASMVGFVNSGGVVSIGFLSLFGFFAYTGFPLMISLASDFSRESASVLGNSLVWGLGGTGGNSVGPLLISALALNNYGRLGASFEAMAALAVVSAVSSFLIPKPPAYKEAKAP